MHIQQMHYLNTLVVGEKAISGYIYSVCLFVFVSVRVCWGLSFTSSHFSYPHYKSKFMLKGALPFPPLLLFTLAPWLLLWISLSFVLACHWLAL